MEITKSKSIQIAIVDDNSIILETLSEKLGRYDDFNVVFTAENGVDFLEKMMVSRKLVEPHIVLMDLDMPVMNGIEAIEKGKERYLYTKFLVLTIYDDDDKIFRAIKAGADGYLLKDESIEKIREAIHHLIKEEGAPMSPSIARRALHLLMNAQFEPFNEKNKQAEESNTEFKLADREREVLTLLVEGFEYKEIGQKLNVSPNTIRNHIASVYKKLHVTSKTQAIRLYMKGKI